MNYFRKIAAMLCILAATQAFAQKEFSKWVFGQNAGLDFSTSPPTVIPGQTMQQEGVASIADANGNLLFYTDGVTVWDKTHAVMANGSFLSGDYSSSQSALIAKKPGSNALYYIFTTGIFGLHEYSEVDMSLAAGLGSLTVKNAPLATDATEKLCGAYHCNGVDFWVVTHDTSNRFIARLVTSAGVSTTPVVSAIGTHHNSNWQGYMKISPNGKKLACTSYEAQAFQLYDFDPLTGVVSNSLTLMSGATNPYGVEFSGDGTKLYGTRETSSDLIYQWDLCAGSPTAIVASLYTITVPPPGFPTALQLNTDGRIYLSCYSEQKLSFIANPNVAGSGCNFVNNGPSIAPGYCRFGLPNFWGIRLPSTPIFTHTVNCLRGFFSGNLNAGNLSTSCSAVGYSLQSSSWNFGDPASGSANTSTLTNPQHNFMSTGTYTVTLVRKYACGADTIRQNVVVSSACVGLEENEALSSFHIYPNPVKDRLTIESQDAVTVRLKNCLGKLLMEEELPPGTGSVNLQDLSPGIYVLDLQNAQEHRIEKISKY